MRILINPIAKPRMTRSDKWNQRDCVMRYRSYCDSLRNSWGDRLVPDTLDLIFTIPMPVSWSGKKRSSMDRTPHQSKPDLDNLLKGFMDALLDDDARIWKVSAAKVWGLEGSIEVKTSDRSPFDLD